MSDRIKYWTAALAITSIGCWSPPLGSAQSGKNAPTPRQATSESALSPSGDFDLDAFIAGLETSTVEEIIASLEPIPSVEEVLAPLPDDPNAPWRRVLADEDAERIEEIETEIENLREEGRFAEAIPLAEEAAAIRRRVQGIGHWQTADAERMLDTVRLAANLPIEARADLAEADRDARRYRQLRDQAKYDEALEIIARQYETRRRILGDEHPATAKSMYRLASLLIDKAELDASIAIYGETLSVWRAALGDDHPEVSACLNQMAVVLFRQGKYAHAVKLQCRSAAIDRNIFGNEHPEWALTLNNLGMLHLTLGELHDAERLLNQTLELRRGLLPEEHPDVASSLNNLGGVYKELGEYARGEALFREALAMWRKLHGDEHPEVAVCLDNLGRLLGDKGEFEEAERVQREALSIRRKVFKGEHPEVAKSLHNLANALQGRGDYSEAEPLYREALRINRAWWGDVHPSVAATLDSLALLLRRTGDYEESEVMFREALEIGRMVHGDEHPNVAVHMGNLADLLQEKGDYPAALRLCRATLAMRRRLLGEAHAAVATSLNNLAGLLSRQGDLDAAEEYYHDALAICRRTFGEEHYHVARTLNNLGAVLRDRGDYSAAETYYRDALAMKRRLRGEHHPSVATTLNNLAAVLGAQGDYVGAESLYRESLQTFLQAFGKEHPRVLLANKNLARNLTSQGKLTEAEPYYREALRIAERLRTGIIGDEQSRAAFAGELNLAGIAEGYASLLIKTGRPDEAWSVMERGRSRAFLDLLARNDRDLVDQARSRAERSGDAKTIKALDGALQKEERVRVDMTTAEALLAVVRKQRRRIDSRDDLSREDKAARLAKLDRRIGEQESAVKSKRGALADAGANVLVQLRGLLPDAKPMSVEQIRAGLRGGELALGYIWTKESVALLVAPQMRAGEVMGFILAKTKQEVAELTDLARRVRQTIEERPTSSTGGVNAEDLDKLFTSLIPDALKRQVDGAQRVIVLPDGPLHDLPFEVLAWSDHASAKPASLSDKQIVYADSASMYLNRRSVAAQSPRTGPPSALVLGNPVFDREPLPEPDYPSKGVLIAAVTPDGNAAEAGLLRGDVLLTYGEKPVPNREALKRAMAETNKAVESGKRDADEPVKVSLWRNGKTKETRVALGRLGVQSSRGTPAGGLRAMAYSGGSLEQRGAEASVTDQVRLYGGVLRPLPGTAAEAAQVARIVRSAGGDVAVLLGEDATIDRLNRSVAGKRFVHLATHGLTGNTRRPYDASLALTQPKNVTPRDIGFLRLDDLIRTWRGKLKDCELVVLSACETQRGVKRGTGMMALPWGFMYAGAPTVVASLWKVDDTAAALLMIRFYENLLGRNDEQRNLPGQAFEPGARMPKAEALREAKRWLRSLNTGQVEALCAKYDLARPAALTRGEAGPMGTGRPTARPFEHPYYWAAFILIGDPE